MRVWLLYEMSKSNEDCLIMVCATKEIAEKTKERLSWRACKGYRIVGTSVVDKVID